MEKRISQMFCPVDLCVSLGMHPNTKLVDAVEILRDEKNIHVEVFLSDTSSTHTRKKNEYTIRVSDGTGGNVSRYSTKKYSECLEDGLKIAARICSLK